MSGPESNVLKGDEGVRTMPGGVAESGHAAEMLCGRHNLRPAVPP